MEYERTIKVYCTVCREWIDEKDVLFEDIHEGVQREDILTFTCPEGHKHQVSRRIG
jgi:hypothetical protein